MNQPAELWMEENNEHLDELNHILRERIGQEFTIKMYRGRELESLTHRQFLEIANCYKEVFNESWGESWTTASAMKEVKDSLKCSPHRIPIAMFLNRNECIVGFAWGMLLDKEDLMLRDMNFYLPKGKKQEGIDVLKYWLDNVAKKKECSFIENSVY